MKHSRSNSFFVLPSIDRGMSLVVPPKQIKKVYGLPDTILDVHTTANATIQTKWTIWDDEVAENNFQMNLVRNQITRNLDILTPPIAVELEEGFKRDWGTSTENWKKIDVWKSALRVIGGAANSAFCGPELCTSFSMTRKLLSYEFPCKGVIQHLASLKREVMKQKITALLNTIGRNMDFIQRVQAHSICFFLGAIVINSTPWPFKSLSGFTVGWVCYYHLQRVSAICLPVVKERLVDTARLREDPTYPWSPPVSIACLS